MVQLSAIIICFRPPTVNPQCIWWMTQLTGFDSILLRPFNYFFAESSSISQKIIYNIKVVFSFYRKIFRADSMMLQVLRIVFRLLLKLIWFFFTDCNNNWWKAGRFLQQWTVSQHLFCCELQFRLKPGKWERGKIKKSTDGQKPFYQILRQSVIIFPWYGH